jgi:hypothetical protein
MAVQSLDALEGEVARIAVVRMPGPLVPAIRQSSEKLTIEPLHRVCRLLRHWEQTRWLEALLSQIIAVFILLRFRPDLVYLNTCESAGYVRPALRLGRPVVLHVHEARKEAERMLRPYRLRRLYRRITRPVKSWQT